jgi:hypothetical protein
MVSLSEALDRDDPRQEEDVSAKSCEARWSQWVDATLAQSLLVGVYEADFVRARRFTRNKALFRF